MHNSETSRKIESFPMSKKSKGLIVSPPLFLLACSVLDLQVWHTPNPNTLFMKNTITSFVVVLALSQMSSAQESVKQSRQTQSQKVENYYKQAERAYQAGDMAGTKTALRGALTINPNHGPSYALALKLKKSGGSFKVKARERELAAVILPVVDFQDEPLSEALQILSELVEKTSEKKVYPNFVIQDRSGVLKDKEVTLNMKNVPAKVVLDYLMNIAGATAKFDQYAITIKPRG